MIGLETRRALVTCYASIACRLERMSGVLDRTRETLVRVCGGTESDRQIL